MESKQNIRKRVREFVMLTKAKVALEARQNDFTYGTKTRPTSKSLVL